MQNRFGIRFPHDIQDASYCRTKLWNSDSTDSPGISDNKSSLRQHSHISTLAFCDPSPHRHQPSLWSLVKETSRPDLHQLRNLYLLYRKSGILDTDICPRNFASVRYCDAESYQTAKSPHFSGEGCGSSHLQHIQARQALHSRRCCTCFEGAHTMDSGVRIAASRPDRQIPGLSIVTFPGREDSAVAEGDVQSCEKESNTKYDPPSR
jgi:hypothetical protein